MADAHFSDYGQIYFVEHKDTGRVYVGQTTRQLGQRWNEHQKSSYCNLLYRAIKKYGKDRFDIYPVDYANTQLELNAKEVFYIDLLNSASREFGFNLRAGGSHGKHSDESKQKMSASVRKAYENPEFKAKLSAAKLGVKHTPERIAKVSIANTGKKHTAESKLKMSDASLKAWANPEFRAKSLAAQSLAKGTDEFRAKVSENTKKQWAANTDSMLSNIHRARMIGADARALTWSDPEKRAARIAKMSIASSGKVPSQETKEKLSAALKGQPKPPRTKEHSAKIAEAIKKHYAAKKAAQI